MQIVFFICSRNRKVIESMKWELFDMYSKQTLHELHRYRAVMFSPTTSGQSTDTNINMQNTKIINPYW